MDEDFFLARTRWVDKSKRCQRNSFACENCTRNCGTNMFAGDAKCAVDMQGNDDGSSPRLMMCYNCCVRKNCADHCKDYHKRRCQPQQCSKGNLLEFTLEPSWDSSQEGRFFCNIAPIPRQHLLDLDYTVKSQWSDEPLHSNTIVVFGDKQWEEKGTMKYSDGIVDIDLSSSLGEPPNFLEGEMSIHSRNFKVGLYKSHGARFGNSAVGPDFIFLRPPAPHGIPDMPDAHQECTHPPLHDMLLASNMENPYLRNSKLKAMANDSLPFIISNKMEDPVVRATLSQSMPILQKLFSPTKLDLKSFTGDLTQNETHWVITVEGRVYQCPGFLHIEIRDSNYPNRTLFNCDTAIMCPKEFSLTFALPTSDKQGMFKDVEVTVEDQSKLHHFRIYRRSRFERADTYTRRPDKAISAAPVEDFEPAQAKAVRDKDHDADEDGAWTVNETPNWPLPFPYLLAICGIITLLLVLAILGMCFQPEVPVKDTPYARWYHPVFAVGYMTFQFWYSVVVSGTVFFLILTVLTSDHVHFILQYGQSGAVSTASSHIELLQLQRHLEAEVAQQDKQADEAQKTCMTDVARIVKDMKVVHKSLLEATEDTFERHRLDLLLNEQKLHVRKKLSRDLLEFRTSYTKAARSALRKVNQNALASFQNVQDNNTWLDGARFLYEAVKLFRKTHRKEVQSFMEWTGINAELNKLEIDLAFSLPALPRLDDIPVPPPNEPPIKRDLSGEFPENEPIRSIQVHNNWFMPLEESGISGASGYRSMDRGDQKASRTETSTAFFVFIALFLICDLILLAHRMCKAWTIAKLLISGFPEYFRERKDMDVGDDDVFASKESKNRLAPVQGCKDSQMFQSIKLFFTQTISTTFFPKIVGAIAVCLMLIFLLQMSNQYLNVKQLGHIGLYHSADKYLDLQVTMTNARLQTHADYINTVDFPAFQSSIDSHISRHKTMLGLYHKQLTGLQSLSREMYCQHLKAIGVAGNCSNTVDPTEGAGRGGNLDMISSITHLCQFHPVVPDLFVRTKATESLMSERQVEALLESLRYIIFYCSQLVVIYLTVIVLKELGCAVLWILIQRSGIIRLKIIVEHDHDEAVH